jgi:hypothetical protein
MRALALTLLAALLALAPATARAQPRPIVVLAGEVLRGDIATVDRPVLIDGVVEGDVTSWSGPITVRGEVRGDVVSYAGAITLGPAARVGGSVLSVAGGVTGEPAAVAGQLMGAAPVAGSAVVAGLATIFGRQPATVAVAIPRPLVSGLLALLAAAIGALFAAMWPARTAGAALALRRRPMRSGGVGLLTTLLLAILLPPLGSLIALSLVGLPLLVPLLIALQLPYLFGLAAMGRLLAEAAGGRGLRPPVAAGLGALAILLPLVAVGAAAPALSAGLFYLLAGWGLGAAILSRGGAYALAARG